jgi:putative effector of murein hydrolase
MNRIKWLTFSLATFMAATALLLHFTHWEPFGIASILTGPVLIYLSLRYSRYLEE